jgi:hypothetical protein
VITISPFSMVAYQDLYTKESGQDSYFIYGVGTVTTLIITIGASSKIARAIQSNLERFPLETLDRKLNQFQCPSWLI